MSQTLGIVVSYNPTQDILKNIQAVLKQVSKVIVVDNDSSLTSRKILSQLNPQRVEVIFNDSNRGIAAGFNQGLQWGLQNDFQWFLLLDQDSRVTEGMVQELIRVSRLQPDSTKVIVGPRHEDFHRKIPFNGEEEFQEIPLLISSGCLLNRQVVEHIGFYDESLFIDHVDHDYALRLQRQGGRCLQVNTATLLHRFGEAKVCNFCGKNFFIQNYNARRRYYMMRNRIILYKRYGLFSGSWFWWDLRSAIKDFVKLVFFEPGKFEKLKAVLLGFKEGIFWQD